MIAEQVVNKISSSGISGSRGGTHISGGSLLQYRTERLLRRKLEGRAIDRRSRACVVSANVRSVLNERDELEAFVAAHFPVVIALTETWLTPDVLDSEVELPGYASFHSDRAQPRMGGASCVLFTKVYSLLTSTAPRILMVREKRCGAKPNFVATVTRR
ncbi:unnamed protein product [Echinostoma caproni]|uniref:Endo/exonuclease/phosphatase domain-containing protein n=1 Tax=Echinostoma caproni TaxID=27848 RepID=A0A183B7F8_9TREM|nr:unnamed protein product [Echinostoma caproni]